MFGILCIMYLMVLEVLLLGFVVLIIAPILFVSHPATFHRCGISLFLADSMEHHSHLHWSASNTKSQYDQAGDRKIAQVRG